VIIALEIMSTAKKAANPRAVRRTRKARMMALTAATPVQRPYTEVPVRPKLIVGGVT
jgi:hypothetical protein